MVKLSVSVQDPSALMIQYDSIKLYRSPVIGGTYLEVPTAIVSLDSHTQLYYLYDSEGSTLYWYKTTFFNSTTLDESAQSQAVQGGVKTQLTGYTFDNYSVPTDQWGEIVTADDIRYTYLQGIDLQSQDLAKSVTTDDQLRYFIKAALREFETTIGICIKRRRFVTRTEGLVRAHEWTPSVDFTDKDEPYDFDPQLWSQFGFLQLRHYPVIAVTEATLLNVLGGKLLDLVQQKWVRLYNRFGQISFYPTEGVAEGPFAVGANFWRINLMAQYPQAFKLTYDAGFEDASWVPEDMRDVIAKLAAVKILASAGEGMMPTLGSSSISLDGLSESFSPTQGPNTMLFGGRIKQYIDDIKGWLNTNKSKYTLPMSFVGSI